MIQEDILQHGHVLNELKKISSLSFYASVPDLKKISVDFNSIAVRVRQAWTFTALSNIEEQELARYFEYHTTFLTKLIASCTAEITGLCSCSPYQTFGKLVVGQLCSLLDDLFQYFGRHGGGDILLPSAYKAHFVAKFEYKYQSVNKLLGHPVISEKLRNSLSGYIYRVTVDDEFLFTLNELKYFQRVILELSRIYNQPDLTDINDAVFRSLLDLNFNHLDVFVYHQESIRRLFNGKSRLKKIKLIREHSFIFRQRITAVNDRYDPSWQSIPNMLCSWLGDELRILNPLTEQPQHSFIPFRLQLQLSVAHIACLIRLFTKQQVFAAIPLTEVFDFFANNFSSKRTKVFTAKGISKEYYEKDLVSAAEIKALLMKMIAQINLEFFPVLAAIGATIYFH